MSLIHVIILGRYYFHINECSTVVKLNYNLQFSVFHYFFFKECHVRLTTRVVPAVWHVYCFTIGDTQTEIIILFCVHTHAVCTLCSNLKCIMCRIKMWKYLQIEPKSKYYLEYKTMNNKFNFHRQWIHRII